jgi:hypothetical protein
VLPGSAVVAGLWGVAAATGLLEPELVWSAGQGVLGAIASALAAAVLHARMAAQRDDSGFAAGAGVTRALALGFLCKLAAFGAGAACVLLAGLKFRQVAAFAIAFAAAALVCQAMAALGLVRQMSAAAQGPRGGAGPATGGRASCSPEEPR